MEDNRTLALIVGAFVLAGLAALAVTILSLSSQQGVWRDRYELVAYFDNVQGLISNSPVWLAGTQVGRVESVSFSARPDGSPALVAVLQIDRDVQKRIRGDSVASIGTIGLLGDKYVEVSLGTGRASPLAGGDAIRTQNPTDLNQMIDRGAVALDNIASLAENLDAVVEDFQSATGGRQLAGSVGAIAEMIDQIQNGGGLLHSLIYDEYEGEGVESVEHSLEIFENILKEIETGEGVLHSLIYEPLDEQSVVNEAFEAGSKLNNILAKIDGGEGTIGLLINDPTLYEDMKILVNGAQRSAVVRTMIRLSSEEEK